jgi:hypothetical protein
MSINRNLILQGVTVFLICLSWRFATSIMYTLSSGKLINVYENDSILWNICIILAILIGTLLAGTPSIFHFNMKWLSLSCGFGICICFYRYLISKADLDRVYIGFILNEETGFICLLFLALCPSVILYISEKVLLKNHFAWIYLSALSCLISIIAESLRFYFYFGTLQTALLFGVIILLVSCALQIFFSSFFVMIFDEFSNTKITEISNG